ncbi:MAG: SDR family NAD(P)-dependent oxidoreductase [Burkholderiales bacterium]|uniref:SDR family NAD(P)-dependent oxidoreductase n=1 Tax=Roseateles sp. TaxID=1971397 RepID=UPI000FA7DDBC|nr:MAG: SDR family NAD(P)-dependent oxidoreductase [Burkholderiales bacterium]
MKPADFAGRYGPWAIVTGASDGLGAAFAAELAAQGLNLVLCARRAERLEALAADLRQRHGIEARCIALDLGDAALQERLHAFCEPLDIGLLVAAAGFGSAGPWLASDPAEDAAMLAVNCGAVLAQSRWLAPRLARRGRGGLLLLSSIVAFQGCPGSAHYAATKAWVQTLAEGLRAELAPAGVDVLAVAPGPVASGFGARAGMDLANATPPAVVAAAALQALPGGGTSRPGAMAKLLGWSLATAPRPLRVRLMGRIMAGLTRARPATPKPA